MKYKIFSRESFFLLGFLFTSLANFSQVTEKWVKRQNGDANARDMANALVIDNKGNVIVTGIGDADINSVGKWVTVKYNNSGSVKWVKRYSGPGSGANEATAIATDSKGNIYVTGRSAGSETGGDITTIKYDDDGDTIWVKRFNGPGNSNDEASAIAVDSKGNVYVTGWSTGNGTGRDITTIKYDDDGNVKWVKMYNGPGNDLDEARAIAVDKYGNVFITGLSTGVGTANDITTIKYSDDGEEEWVNRYNGPVNLFDYGKDLALDNNGNVYITGYIATADMETDETDIITIKYNSSGLQQWANIYNRDTRDESNDLAIDASGNIYITGFAGSAEEDPDNDYLTIKYNSAGVQLWDALYSGAGFEQGSEASALMLDAAGNVYVTGGSSIQFEVDYTTIKYNTNGVQQWIAIYDGPGNFNDRASAIGIDKDGNVFITGRSMIDNFDYATIKYNPNGTQKWLRRFNGVNDQVKGGPDYANSLALDKEGNIHVTGNITRLDVGLDYTTYKYDEDANRIWKKTYSGTGIGPDQSNDIVVDNQGNVYITGKSDGGASREDIATIKYSKDGNTKWVKRYNGTGNLFDEGVAIAVDKNGNVYVTGTSRGSTSFNDYVTIKYDKDGNTKWVKRYNGPGNGIDQPKAISVDKSGNVYVTGQSHGGASLDDYATIKYDTYGNQLWVARYNGPNNTLDYANAMVIDGSGNVYVTGGSFGSSRTRDFTTIKYNTAGVQQWVVRYEGSGSSFEEANAIALDANGNVYVTGESQRFYTTVKYNNAGTQQWVATYNGGNFSVPSALAIDAMGNVYVTGSSSTSIFAFFDYVTVKYNAAGIEQWVARYDGPAQRGDVATDIAVDKYGNVYVTGSSEGISTVSDYATIKYEQTNFAIAMSANNPAVKEMVAAKLQVKAFPNAFTQFINLQWNGINKPVTITITDMLGRIVEKKAGLASNGTITIGHTYKPGVYFAEIVQGNEKLVIKLVKN